VKSDIQNEGCACKIIRIILSVYFYITYSKNTLNENWVTKGKSVPLQVRGAQRVPGS